MKDLEFFIENKNLSRLNYLKNRKSNLILNLSLKKDAEYLKDLKKIGNLELQIADLEIQNGNIEKATYNLLSSIKFFIKIKDDFHYKIALRALLDSNFDHSIKKDFFSIIKTIPLKKQKISQKSIDFLKYIINEYVDYQFDYNRQKINKSPLFIFSNLKFNEIFFFDIPKISISVYPYYSDEIIDSLNSYQNCKIIRIQNNLILPDDNYKEFIKNDAFRFELTLKQKNGELIEKVHRLIKDFSNWDSLKILNWEKKLGLMEYFKTGESIN